MIVGTFGGHFKDEIGSIAQELPLRHRGVHSLQHGHQSVQSVPGDTSLAAPEVLYQQPTDQPVSRKLAPHMYMYKPTYDILGKIKRFMHSTYYWIKK